MKFYTPKLTAGIILVLSLFLMVNKTFSKERTETIVIEGKKRSYIIYTPDKYGSIKNFPLLLAFHGDDCKASKFMKHSGFNELAEKEGFLVVYPQGLHNYWNDSRNSPAISEDQDDIKFISILIDKLITEYSINKNRIFATGFSNGGIFSLYLAFELKNKIRAIAPVCASYPENLKLEFEIGENHSVLVINGDADPFVPFYGGFVYTPEGSAGSVLGTEIMIKEFVKKLNCNNRPIAQEYENVDDTDNCSAKKKTYNCPDSNNSITLITIKNGGHSWPGKKQISSKNDSGNTCMDFDATKEIWKFFKNL